MRLGQDATATLSCSWLGHSGIAGTPWLTDMDAAPLDAIATSFVRRKALDLHSDDAMVQNRVLCCSRLAVARRPARASTTSRRRLWDQHLHAKAGPACCCTFAVEVFQGWTLLPSCCCQSHLTEQFQWHGMCCCRVMGGHELAEDEPIAPCLRPA